MRDSPYYITPHDLAPALGVSYQVMRLFFICADHAPRKRNVRTPEGNRLAWELEGIVTFCRYFLPRRLTAQTELNIRNAAQPYPILGEKSDG